MSYVRHRVAAVLPCILCACASWQPTYREMSLGSVPLEDAWNEVVKMAEIDGLPLDAAVTDRGQRVLQTLWRTRAVPFRGSVRRRLHAEFEQPEGGGAWKVRYYVEQQRVSEVGKGFEPEEEDWEANGQDSDLEERFAVKLAFVFHRRSPGAPPPGSP